MYDYLGDENFIFIKLVLMFMNGFFVFEFVYYLIVCYDKSNV